MTRPASIRLEYGGSGILLEYVRRTLSAPAAIVSSRVERGRSELEELVDLAVERALTRLPIPTRRDMEALFGVSPAAQRVA